MIYQPYKKTISRQSLFVCVLSFVALILTTNAWSSAHDKENSPSLLQQNMQLSLKNLSQNIDARMAKMKLIASSIANDSYIHNWVQNGFAKDQELLLVSKLGFFVEEFGLTSASFADKDTHKYWNHEGFLRVLTPDIDTWYFAYLESEEQDLVSVYHDNTKHRVDVYVNYQQTDGNGLSGIATSFDGVVEMLNASDFARQGDVYLVDRAGKVQVHANSNVAGNLNLKDVFDASKITSLLDSTETQIINIDKESILGTSYIPSMNWYVVVAIAI